MASSSQTSTQSSSAPRPCACTSGASAYWSPVEPEAPLSLRWRRASWNRWWRLTWISSTCLATPTGRACVRPCARTSRRRRLGPNWATREAPTCANTNGRFAADGQVFVRPWSFDKWRRALDAALTSFGSIRGCAAHGNVKSSARLLCPPERMSDRLTSTALSPSSPQTRGPPPLVFAFGSREQINARAWSRCALVTKRAR